MGYLQEITLDTNIWTSLSTQDADIPCQFLQAYKIKCLLSTPVRTELLCHLNNKHDKDFRFCKGAIRKITRLCDRDTLLVPEVEFLRKIGFHHYINPEWVVTQKKAQDDFITLEVIANSEDDWTIDTTQSLEKKKTDIQSFTDLVNATRKSFAVNREGFWCKFLEFFILGRTTLGPTKGRTLYKDLTQEEQEIFRNACDFPFLFNHLEPILQSLGAREDNPIQGNHVYDMLQLLLLGNEHRALITNDGAFHRGREKVLRIMKWEEFKSTFILPYV